VGLSAWIRTDGIPASGRGGAGLVLTAMRGSSILAHEFMKKTRLRGTGDWKRVSIELALPARTTRLEVGATLEGDGRVGRRLRARGRRALSRRRRRAIMARLLRRTGR
jgi:hypothetical protein